MQFLEWKETYNIGIKEIDNQHRGLFDLISKLSTTQRYEPSGQYFLATLNKLVEYARIHFATEERYMREAQYPQLVEHQQEHRLFFPEIEKFMKALEQKQPDIQQTILNYLKDWYMSHILGTDRDYQKTLIEKGFT
jgi:hemerythrin